MSPDARRRFIRFGVAIGAGLGLWLAGSMSHASNKALIAKINAKLAKYVHPTGKCHGAREWLATYYGYESGRRTASGQRFRPLGLTAAHRTLPFGTRLRVTNPHNGRSAEIVVNDRGPYTNANIDLSLGTARALGLRQSSYVCIERL